MKCSVLKKLREAAKKILFLVAGDTKRGGAKRVCHQGRKNFFFNVRKKVPIATKPRGRGS